MKTLFPIMWIDDNEGYFDSLKDEVENIIEDHGLKADICYHNNVTGLLEKIPSCNPYIIVVDFKLGNGMTGDQFIVALRNAGHFHDVLFYTQEGFTQKNFAAFFNSAESPLASGVNFCPKGSTKERIEEIINLKLQQVSDLPTQRGWIVADIIDLECSLNDVIMELSDCITPVFKGTVARVLDNKQRTDFGCKAALLNGILKDLIKTRNQTGAKSELTTQLSDVKKIMADFSSQIIEIRNSIAHQKHTVNSCGKIEIETLQRNREPITYGQEFLKQVRKDIQIHTQNFHALKLIIGELRA